MEFEIGTDTITVTTKVTAHYKTGVEMEALTAVSIACLTLYDMVKAVEKGMRIEGIRLLEKQGGKSGHYRADDHPDIVPNRKSTNSAIIGIGVINLLLGVVDCRSKLRPLRRGAPLALHRGGHADSAAPDRGV